MARVHCERGGCGVAATTAGAEHSGVERRALDLIVVHPTAHPGVARTVAGTPPPEHPAAARRAPAAASPPNGWRRRAISAEEVQHDGVAQKQQLAALWREAECPYTRLGLRDLAALSECAKYMPSRRIVAASNTSDRTMALRYPPSCAGQRRSRLRRGAVNPNSPPVSLISRPATEPAATT